MNRRKYFCDDCGHTFHLVGLQTRNLPQGVRHTYFSCPECRTEYHVSYTNKPIRKLHERLNFTREVAAKATDKAEFKRLLAQTEEMTEESRRLMTELKREMTKEDG